jgi:hypothetical protein
MIRLTGIPVHDIATITEPNEFLEMLSSSISMTMIDSQLRDISNVTRFEKGKHPFPRYLVHSFGIGN